MIYIKLRFTFKTKYEECILKGFKGILMNNELNIKFKYTRIFFLNVSKDFVKESFHMKKRIFTISVNFYNTFIISDNANISHRYLENFMSV